MNETVKFQPGVESKIEQKLILMQLSDSFFPSGSYTLSHGLESLVQNSQIKHPSDVTAFLKVLLHNRIGTCDLVAAIHSHQGSMDRDLARIREADARLFAQNAIAITRRTQRQSGRALLTVARSTWQSKQLEILDSDRISNRFNCLHPVVFGVVGNLAGIDSTDTALAFLHSFVTGILGAAIRLGILGHLQAQQISLELRSDMEAILPAAFSLKIDRMHACTPTIDLAQMRHSRLNTRLFAS
ncbi:MAG: urease accessory UreF family protein [Cyanobacteria bacterium P01_G01_bin.19]